MRGDGRIEFLRVKNTVTSPLVLTEGQVNNLSLQVCRRIENTSVVVEYTLGSVAVTSAASGEKRLELVVGYTGVTRSIQLHQKTKRCVVSGANWGMGRFDDKGIDSCRRRIR